MNLIGALASGGEARAGGNTMYLHPLLASLLFIFAGIGLLVFVVGLALFLVPREQLLDKKNLKKFRKIDLEYR